MTGIVFFSEPCCILFPMPYHTTPLSISGTYPYPLVGFSHSNSSTIFFIMAIILSPTLFFQSVPILSLYSYMQSKVTQQQDSALQIFCMLKIIPFYTSFFHGTLFFSTPITFDMSLCPFFTIATTLFRPFFVFKMFSILVPIIKSLIAMVLIFGNCFSATKM